jgi:hypothetical protein
MPRHRPAALVAAILACILLSAGCGGSGHHRDAGPTSSAASVVPTTPPILPKCKLPKRIAFPSWVPKSLPLPSGIYASQKLPLEAGYYRGLFVIPVTTTQFARYVLDKWPKAGWQLGRGDAEPGEVEDQFLKSPAFGAFKAQDMACRKPHSIMLLIYVPDRGKLPSVGTSGGSPLPGQTPTPSSTPFGPSPTPSPSPS